MTKIVKDRIDMPGGAYVELLDQRLANKSENDRIEWTTQLAAISRGKDESKNPRKRYMALMKEAEGERPSRPFEFLPVFFHTSDPVLHGIQNESDAFNLMRFSYIDKDDYMHTNMRALLNIGIREDAVPFNREIKNFAAFKIKAPMFVWAQIVTHTQLSTESQSDRVSEEYDYWLPEDIEDRISENYGKNAKQIDIDKFAEKVGDESFELLDAVHDNNLPLTADGFKEWMIDFAPQKDVQILLKALGYKREIYSRAPYYFKMKRFVITGWLNDDFAWPHFLRERNAYMNDGGPKNWTQPETQQVSYAIRILLERNGMITKESILEGVR